MLYISDTAQQYFIKLLNQQKKGTQIRIFLSNLNTLHSKCNICYYFPIQNNTNDIIIKFNLFSVYINQAIAPFIKKTTIDLISNELGTHLSISSPNLHTLNDKIKKTDNQSSSLEDRITHILNFQINPQLAIHGGSVSLIRITKDFSIILKFHGGCNGCAMSYYTIKEGIEKTLKKNFPELKEVIDVTQHQRGLHSYY